MGSMSRRARWCFARPGTGYRRRDDAPERAARLRARTGSARRADMGTAPKPVGLASAGLAHGAGRRDRKRTPDQTRRLFLRGKGTRRNGSALHEFTFVLAPARVVTRGARWRTKRAKQ